MATPKTRFVSITLLFYILCMILKDCSSNPGTEFLLVFPQSRTDKDYDNGEIAYEIFITLDSTVAVAESHVTLTLKDPDEEHHVTLNQTTSGVVLGFLDSRTFPQGNHQGKGYLMRAVASHDVTIVVKNGKESYSNTDNYMAIPVSQLGKTYVALAYRSSSNIDSAGFIVVAAGSNPAVVKITLPVELMASGSNVGIELTYNNVTYESSDVIRLNLDSFEACQLQFMNSDITGTLIESDSAAIAVWAGNNRTQLQGTKSKDHVVEQMPPIEMAGKQFVACARCNQNPLGVYRVINVYQNTEVTVHSSGEDPVYYSLSRIRSVLELSFSVRDEVSYIETSKPSMVVYISPGYSNGFGDVFSMLIPPLDADFPATYTFQIHYTLIATYMLSFVVQGSVSDLRINRHLLTTWGSLYGVSFSYYGVSAKNGYVCGCLTGTNGVQKTYVLHHIRGIPFLAWLEVLGNYIGWGQPLSYGLSFPNHPNDSDDDACCVTVDSRGVSLFDKECADAEKATCCVVDYQSVACKAKATTASCQLLHAPKTSSYQRDAVVKTLIDCDVMCAETDGCLGVNVDQAVATAATVNDPASGIGMGISTGIGCQLLFGSTFGYSETASSIPWRYLKCSTVVRYDLN